jgi:hypothetical protein
MPEEVPPGVQAQGPGSDRASGRKVAEVARDLGVSGQTIYNWRNQDRIDRGERPGLRSPELAELQAARRRIAELETELAATKRASELLKVAVPPKGRFGAIVQTPIAPRPSSRKDGTPMSSPRKVSGRNAGRTP